MYEPQNTDPTDEFTLLKVIADIREKTGIGDKVMLKDLADVLGGIARNERLTCQILEERKTGVKKDLSEYEAKVTD